MVNRIRHHISRHPHFTLIFIAFLSFRLLMPLGFTSLGPDIGDFMRWGALADSRLYPYVHYWSEYPPLFGWTSVVLYRLSTFVPAWSQDPRFWFGLIVKIAMALFDAGNLYLVYAIALRLGGKARAVRTAALFAGGFITAYAAWGWYDVMPLFFLLLALYLSLRDRPAASAVAAAVGLMLKVLPITMVPVTLRRIAGVRQQARYAIALGATILAIALPFLVVGAPYLMGFVRGILNRPTWGSIWAALEGRYEFGFVAPVAERFSIQTADLPAPSQLPWPIIHLAFAALFLFLYTRRTDWRAPAKSVAFAGLTVNLFLLWSKGFSGQFTVYAFPFILLLMPNWRGVLYAGLLSVVWIAEWPMALFTTPPGTEQPSGPFMLWIILTRTATFAALCLEYVAILFPRAAMSLPRVARAIMAAGWISILPMSILLIDTYARTQLAADPAAPGVQLIRDNADADNTIVFAASRIFRRLYPLASTAGDTLLLPLAKHVPEEVRLKWLNDLTARGPFWLVADESDPGMLEENRQAETWLSEHACKVGTQVAGSARVSRFVGNSPAPIEIENDASAVFADEIASTGARLSASALQPGDGVCLEIDWLALASPAADYTVFVHLIDAQGRLVAQNDMPPRGGFAPTGSWEKGTALTDRHGLILPANLPPGEYILRLGLYRSDNQTPVPVTHGSQILPDAVGIQLATVSVIP